MRMNLRNAFNNMRPYLEGTGYIADLEQLICNLEELHERHAAGDCLVVDEFMSLYCFDRPAKEE